MQTKKETIFALSSGYGKSATALIRLSGPKAYQIIKKISSNMPTKPNLSQLNKIIDGDGEVIDKTLTTFFKSPKSFTGEDMVEISFHGSNAVIKKIIQVLGTKENARLANPGEFTRRAFENNKLDLTQVEAISDIVNAETEMQRKQAIEHLSGSFFKSTKKIFYNLKKILANIEATIDFVDEELPENLLSKIKEQIENNICLIEEMLKNSSSGISIREGFSVVILGDPNSGKSSFINYISKKDIAIVTSTPGTTRDLIESFIDLQGYPVKFIDTAGIRKSSNKIEKIGIKKAYKASESADINLVFFVKKSEKEKYLSIKNTIFIKSKQDITKKSFKSKDHLNISSKTGYGIERLLLIIKKKISKKTPYEKSYISRERHLDCLKKTLKNLKNSQKPKNIDIYAEDIRLAIKDLSRLFGNVDIEDILDIIFNDFCIGK